MIWLDFVLPLELIITATVSVAAMQTAWTRRQSPGARSFAYMLMAIAIWTFGAAFEHLANTFYLKVFWTQIQALGAVFLPVFWFLFTLEYNQVAFIKRPLFKFLRLFLGILSVIILILIVTNPWHGFAWKDIRVISESPQLSIEFNTGTAYWLLIGFGYFLMFMGVFVLVWGIVRFPNMYRRQGLVLILGIAVPWGMHLSQLVGFYSQTTVAFTPAAFLVTGILYSYELYRHHLFDLIPIAQDTVVEAMSEGVMVIDDGDRIVYINPAARMILNWDAPLPSTAQNPPPFWPVVQKLLNQSNETSLQSIKAELHQNEPASRYIELRTDPLFHNRSHLLGRLVIIRDVTAARDAEEQIRLQSVALASAPSSIIITDRDGNIQWVNPAFTDITGFSSEEALGRTPTILKSGKHNPSFYKNLWDTILSGMNWQGEIINCRKDGSLYVEETTIAPVQNELGEISNFIAIKQNISERKDLEKLRDDLIQAIIHDLRNPINTILFSLDMFQSMSQTQQIPEDLLSTIELSRENAWRILGMINSMLDLNRLESGSMPLILEPVVLAELAEQTIHLQSLIAQRREILILNNIPYDLPPVKADRILISRVMQNLLDNAIKFTTPGSNIEISAEQNQSRIFNRNAGFPEDPLSEIELGFSHSQPANTASSVIPAAWIIVSIHDDGPGIPAELRGLVFNKFTTGTSSGRGTGVGLAFCRQAVEAHQGHIWFDSAEGQGTTFRFSLPVEVNRCIQSEAETNDARPPVSADT